MALYYLEDNSLGEIAEEYNISRQAVYDNIKRTEQMLEQYEEKLLLFQKFQERQQLINQLKETLLTNPSKEDLLTFIESLEKLD